MLACNHVFIGRADGVRCTRCGLHMSAREYGEYCAAKEEAAKGNEDCAQFAKDVDAGEYTTEAVIVNKPKRTRKKKGESDHE